MIKSILTFILFVVIVLWFACDIVQSKPWTDQEVKHMAIGGLTTAVGMKVVGLWSYRVVHEWIQKPDGTVSFHYGITENPSSFTTKALGGLGLTLFVANVTNQSGEDTDNMIRGCAMWIIGEFSWRMLKIYVFK